MKYSEEKEKELSALENKNVLCFRDRTQWWRYNKLFKLQLIDEYWRDYDKAVAELTAIA